MWRVGEIIERTVPAKPLAWTGERLTTEAGGQVEIEHLHRYIMARDYCRGLDVLDIASGEGYGTALLAQVAKSATGVEVSAEAAGHAAREYRQPNLRFLEGDARKLPLADDSVDVVVSFETIEHLYDQDAFLAEVKRVLRPAGQLVISSPNSEVYSPPGSPANQYHVRELSRTEFASLIERHFSHVNMVAQRPVLGSVLISDGAQCGSTVTIERRGAVHFERNDGLPHAVYFVAIASDAQLEPLPASLFIESSEIGLLMSKAASFLPAQDALREAVHRAEAAETAFHASREEIAKCMREASDERNAAAAMLEAAEQQRSDAQAALLALQQQVQTAQGVHQRADQQADTEDKFAEVLAELKMTRSQLKQASNERDMARVAVRRTAIHSGLGWKERVSNLTDQLSEAETRAAMLTSQLNEVRTEADIWAGRYYGLRARLDRVLRRTGLFQLSRLLPQAVRRFLRDSLAPASRV